MADEVIDVGRDMSAKPRRFDVRDLGDIAEQIIDEYGRRKRDRAELERHWDEVDRQVRMEPDIAFKKMADGKADTRKAWMAEIELPLQAQALEVLNADASSFRFPDTGLFFRAHAECPDDYLEKINFQSIIKGDQTEVPSQINQDNADKLVEGYLASIMFQGDFRQRIKRIDAGAFKYGMGVGRARMETKNVYMDEAKGTRKESDRLPVLVPCSIKNLYLDDPKPSMHTAQVLGPAHIAHDNIRYANLAMAANKGSTDPKDEDGGWIPKNFKQLEPDKNGYVQTLEMEGDIILPRKTTRSMVLPGCIVTVALGGKDGGGNVTRAVIRLRFKKDNRSSYILFPYQYESADDIYPASPLMKGRPIQMAASQATNRLLDSAMLKLAPPVGYDSADKTFALAGGPNVEPYAQWPSVAPDLIKAYTELGGDPSVMSAALTNFLSLYAELTGILPGRLGAQTVSHTTAYAKGAELQRGAVRTVNYVNATGNGPILRWLDMAYKMGRDNIKSKTDFYIESYNGFVEVDSEQLPPAAVFEWLGSGGPGDESQKLQAKVNGLLLAAKLDAINAQTQQPMHINYNKAIEQVLRESGWTDLDTIVNAAAANSGANIGPGPAVAALQNLQNQLPQ